jgi:hypothetical protein
MVLLCSIKTCTAPTDCLLDVHRLNKVLDVSAAFLVRSTDGSSLDCFISGKKVLTWLNLLIIMCRT